MGLSWIMVVSPETLKNSSGKIVFILHICFRLILVINLHLAICHKLSLLNLNFIFN